MKRLINKLRSGLLIFMAATLGLSLASPAMSVYAAAGEYESGGDSIALDVNLEGESINTHTVPLKLWTNDNGQVLVAVKATHELSYMDLGTPSVRALASDADVYGSGVEISIDGTSYNPKVGLQGNTKDAHWTVFYFPISAIYSGSSNQFKFFIKGIGGGHDVGGYFNVTIPTAIVKVTKTWVNGPKKSVSIQLYRQIGSGQREAVELPPIIVSIESPTVTIGDLPYTNNLGQVYKYSFEEADPGEGYTVSYSDSAAVYDPVTETYTYNFTLTNTYTSPKTPIVAEKEWVNGDATNRPTIYFELWRKNGTAGEGEKVVDKTVVANNQVDFGQQDKRDINGVVFDYYVKEIDAEGNNLAPDNYTMVESGLTVTNTYTSPKTPIVAEKKWVNGDATNRPTIYFELWRKNGTAGEGEKVVDKTVVANNQVDFGNQDETDINGVTYSYYVKEVNAQGVDFTPENYTKLENGLTVTNTYEIPKTDITGNKVWVDGPEVKPTIQLQLYQGDVTYDEPVTLENGIVEYTWKNLDKTDKDGKVHVYTVKEVGVPENYTKVESGLTVTNTYKSPLMDLKVQKKWDGGEIVRPSEITVDLL